MLYTHMSIVNHSDICLSEPPLTLISPDNRSSTVQYNTT